MGSDNTPVIVWFRNDLRTRDNPALDAACRLHGQVRALFVLTPDQWDDHGIAPIRRHFLRRAIDALGSELGELGIPLDIIDAADFTASVVAVCRYTEEHRASDFYLNAEYLVNEIERDRQLEERLAINLHRFHDRLILPPPAVLTQAEKPYSVFSPFAKNWRSQVQQLMPTCLPKPKPLGPAVHNQPCPSFGEEADSGNWAADGEAVIEQLRDFGKDAAPDYKNRRDFPAVEGTSRLSAALAIGLLSPRQCLARLHAEYREAVFEPGTGAGSWLNEIVWREFYHHVAWHFPRVVKGKAFKEETDRIPWRQDKVLFQRWAMGETGFPIVDAAQRQLLETGWMHNRLRMISASFLAKDLQLDWRLGERWFMEHLIDADFPANNGGWQWAASTGTDAAPYFRVFNPTTQGQRFDPDGAFIRRFVPELRAVQGKQIHTPGEAYLEPVVDHKQARLDAIALFEAIK